MGGVCSVKSDALLDDESADMSSISESVDLVLLELSSSEERFARRGLGVGRPHGDRLGALAGAGGFFLLPSFYLFFFLCFPSFNPSVPSSFVLSNFFAFCRRFSGFSS